MPKPSGNVTINYNDLGSSDPNALARIAGLRRFLPEQGPPMPGSEAEFRADYGMPTAEEARRTAYAKLHRELQALPEDSMLTRAGWTVGGIGNALARSLKDYLYPPQRGYMDPMAGFAPGRGAPPMGPQIPQQMIAARPQALNAFAMAPHRTAELEGFYDAVPDVGGFY